MPEATEQVRVSARALVRDAEGRLLLINAHNDPEDPSAGGFWMTPGGGVEPGESLPEAAARELAEEIGLRVTPEQLGTPVAFTTGYAELGWANGVFTDHFFLHRVATHEIDLSGQTDYEQREYRGHRWWPVAELATTEETVFPWGLAELLTGLDRHGRPAEPVQLPWHH
ncbi:RNA pyrophosphohydrolase [Kitasatospora sp. MMS16-BH015]|uniref:NUDIX hydrolase n=1 Tax=Kitasatospora sp. MMS16-BH015 TaxID=2018025 RepID=UPI000CA3DCD9|nr:NUDIX domain-containing protein [Kitasatospora sp. MMS16-BH015]AUG76340.1 RNA pyrophosphohydrolase [Kitasatospora sp. MMS16-BH015]